MVDRLSKAPPVPEDLYHCKEIIDDFSQQGRQAWIKLAEFILSKNEYNYSEMMDTIRDSQADAFKVTALIKKYQDQKNINLKLQSGIKAAAKQA